MPHAEWHIDLRKHLMEVSEAHIMIFYINPVENKFCDSHLAGVNVAVE